ncbi:MAG: hypothetical protein VX185_02335 [Pseudomonadota bacterium]|nr:hypothetical protein [Pseudomonadota bacterium]
MQKLDPNFKTQPFFKLKKLIRSVLLVSAATSLPLAPTLHADELDFIWQNNEGSGTNIMFLLDSSSSLDLPYMFIFSLVDPATNPGNADVQAVNAVISSFNSQLENTALVTPSLGVSHDQNHCPPEYASIQGEAHYNVCPIPLVDRWYIKEMDIIRDVVRDSLPSMVGNNVAVMRTSPNNKGFSAWDAAGRPAYTSRNQFPDPSETTNGAFVIEAFRPINSVADAQALAVDLETTYRSNGADALFLTPIAESIYEAYLYFTGGTSPWSKNTSGGWLQEHLDDIDTDAYTGGINGAYEPQMTGCSSNHIIMVSDGEPTYDWHANSQIQALTGGGVAWPTTGDITVDTAASHTLLDEFTGYLANTDLMPDVSGQQSIITHFISSWPDDVSKEILDTAAANSGGFHEALTDVTELQATLKQLLEEIETTSAPIVGYNALSTSVTGNPFDAIDQAYVNIWEYRDGHWAGNMKKFRINEEGELVDKNGTPVITEEGNISSNLTDYWSNGSDEGITTNGGAASHLSAVGQNRFSIPRNRLGNNVSLRQANFTLRPGNNQFSPADLGANGAAERNELLNWAAGMDTLDIDGDADLTDLRQSLGDQIFKAPTIAMYSNGNTATATVFTGSNDGYLHAIDSQSGQHLFSFMPYQMLKNVKNLQVYDETKYYGMDGDLVVWHNDQNGDYNLMGDGGGIDANEKLMLYFGVGRGGSGVYSLDITSRENPRIAWAVDEQTNGFSRMGESWGKVRTGKVKTGSDSSDVISIIPGGLDTGIRTLEGGQSPNMGNALYVVNGLTGQRRWTVSNTGADINIAGMTNSVISTPTVVDYNKDGFMDAFFFNDIRGQIFRCDFELDGNNISLDCGMIANVRENNENIYFLSDLDVSMIKGTPSSPANRLSISLSSGNRFDPLNDGEARNKLAVIFDYYTSGKPESYNYGGAGPISANQLSAAGENTVMSSNQKQLGWKFTFSHPEYKSFAQTLTYDNKVFVSVHLPQQPGSSSASASSQECIPADLGTAKIFGFTLSDGSPIKVNGQSLNYELWSGAARGVPDTPYMVTRAQSNSIASSLNLGVENTDLDLVVDPLARTYWLQLP